MRRNLNPIYGGLVAIAQPSRNFVLLQGLPSGR